MKFRLVMIIAVLQVLFAPSLVHSANSNLTQLGVAEFKQLRRPYYIGGLYAENSEPNEQSLLQIGGKKRIEIRVVAEKYSQRRFSTQWSQALIVNASQNQLLAFDEPLVRFQNILDEPFQKGDVIAVESDSQGASTVYINHQKVFDVKKPGFVELLLSTWIGNKPPTTEFKQALLHTNADERVKTLFDQLEPSEQRIASIKDLLKPKKKSTAKPVLLATKEPKPKTPIAEPKPIIQASVNSPSTPAPITVPTPAAEITTFTEPDEPEIDPKLYREQQMTLTSLYANTATRAIRSNVKYPRSAMAKRIEGQVKVQVVINRIGEVESMEVVEAADSKILNRAALKAVEDSGKLSAIPPAIDAENVSVVIPFQFAMH